MASPSANSGLSNIPVVSDRWYDDENSVFQFNDFETALSASPRLDSFPGNIMQSASSTGLDFSFNVAYVPVQVYPRFFDQSNVQYHPGLGQVIDVKCKNESLDSSRRESPLSDAPSSKDQGAKVNKSQQASSGEKQSE